MRDDPRTDQELVAAANFGEAEAMTALYSRHRDYVRALAMRLCGNPVDAQDVTQQVFMTFFRQFPGFRLTSRLTTYLYPLVNHAAIDLGRKRQRLVPLDPEALEQEPAEAGGSPDRLVDLVARLSPEHREVILLRYQEELSMEAMAERLGIPAGTVKSRLHYALEALRQEHGG